MQKHGPIIALAAVLALLGWRALPSTAPPAPEAPDKLASPATKTSGDAPSPSATGVASGWDFAQPLEDFRDNGMSKLDPKTEKLPAIGAPKWGISDLEIDFLIATVPDPIDSTSGYRFDSVVDAIRLAAENCGYVFDRYSCPWVDSGGTKVGPPGPSGVVELTGAIEFTPLGWLPHFVSAGRPAERHRRYEEQPGMLLFRSGKHRNSHAYPRLLVVLLVGETAIHGPHKAALTRALQFIRNYRVPDPSFRILGPFFSGSQQSLAQTLVDWSETAHRQGAKYTFTPISGSATAIDDVLINGHDFITDGRIGFKATVIPEEIILRELLNHLGVAAKKKGPLEVRFNVAFLHESNTGYGYQLALAVDATEVSKRSKGGRLVSFPFPLHISDVRTGYSKAGDAGKANWPTLPTFGAKLRIPLDEGHAARETHPTLHPAMTAAAAERQLTAALNTINHERFRYAVIAASDIRDRLFLAALLREHCPDVQLIFTSADLLLSHPDHLAYLRGSVVGSTYPLYAKNQLWSAPFEGNERRISFPSELEQGCYNAAVALLLHIGDDKEWRLLEYGPPFARTPNSPNSALGWRPPIWISIIGQSGPQPLAVVRTPHDLKDRKTLDKIVYVWNVVPDQEAQPQDSEPAVSEDGPTFTPQHTAFWITPFIGLCAFLLWVTVARMGAMGRCRAASPDGREEWLKLTRLFTSRATETDQRRRGPFVAVCLTSALAVSACLTLVSGLPIYNRFVGKPPSPPPMSRAVFVASTVGLMGAPTEGPSAAAAVLIHRRDLETDDPARIMKIYPWQEFTVAASFAFLLLLSYLAMPLRTHRLLSALLVRPKVVARLERFRIVTTYHRFCAWRLRPRAPKPPAARTIWWKAFVAQLSPLAPVIGWSVFLLMLLGRWYISRERFVIGWIVLMAALPLVIAWPRNLFKRRALPFLKRHALPVLVFALALFVLGWHNFFTETSNLIQWWRCFEGRNFFYERATSLSSGVSPVVPLVLLCLGFFWWGHARLNSLYLLDRYRVGLDRSQVGVPFPKSGMAGSPNDERFTALCEGNDDSLRVVELPHGEVWSKASLLVWLALFFTFCRLLSRFTPTAEGDTFDGILLFALTAFAVLQVHAMLELLRLWKAVGHLLAAIARLPMREAYKRLPHRLTAPFGPYLSSGRPGPMENLEDRRRQQELLLKSYSDIPVESAFRKSNHVQQFQQLSQNPLPDVTDRQAVHDSLTQTAAASLSALHCFWEHLPVVAALGDPVAPVDAGKRVPGTAEHWRELAEDFVATEVVTYLSHFFNQLRNLLLFVTGGSLLLLFAVTSYPLQPQRVWLLFAGAIVVTVTALAIYLFVQIERDDLVSRVSGTTPNAINWLQGSLLQNILTFAVPLLGILAAASTDMSDLVHTWIDPLLKTIR